jgi:hypothetical protein
MLGTLLGGMLAITLLAISAALLIAAIRQVLSWW